MEIHRGFFMIIIRAKKSLQCNLQAFFILKYIITVDQQQLMLFLLHCLNTIRSS